MLNQDMSMGRPRNTELSTPLEVAMPQKLLDYLDSLHTKGGFGSSRADIVRNFTWKEVNRLIEVGRLNERP
jgi:hypothetical protein